MAGLAAFFLATSWRRWPDPLIDSGRELYTPWRLSQGAVLYRDVDDFYGPLSQYANAGLFALFGPGLMVLVAANLAVFAAILATLYLLFRRAWGIAAALAAAAIFVSVFGFSQIVTGSYNYALPYAHEATHGFLVCLLLVAVLHRWVEEPGALRSAAAGALFGLTAVLKPEIMLAAGLVAISAMVLRRWRRRPLRPSAAAAGLAGAVLPTAAFSLYFAMRVPASDAVPLACRAWLSVFATTRFTGEVIQRSFLGFDRPWANLAGHARAAVLAGLLVAGIGAAAWAVDRATRTWVRLTLAAALAAAALWLACYHVNWLNTGHCLLGLVLAYVAACVAALRRAARGGEDPGRAVLRLLIAVLAAGLMARMLLNARIYQFGFYQAALAAVLVPAVILGELPEWLGLGRWGRATLLTGTILLLAPGVALVAGVSQRFLRLRTRPIGEGRDRFYIMPPQFEPTGEIVRLISERLRQAPSGETLLVLPEGEMINYLARMPCPVAPFFFFSAAISGGREQAIVDRLARHPPDWVVLISRDLREYGVERYGEAPGRGRLILRWMALNYRPVAAVGGDPLDYRDRGGVILERAPPLDQGSP